MYHEVAEQYHAKSTKHVRYDEENGAPPRWPVRRTVQIGYVALPVVKTMGRRERDGSRSPPWQEKRANHRDYSQVAGNGRRGEHNRDDHDNDRRDDRRYDRKRRSAGDERDQGDHPHRSFAEGRPKRHRERSRERDRTSGDHQRHKRSASPGTDESFLDLDKIGVRPISQDDYFIKSHEFKYWLKEARGKYLTEMSSESAHKYFRKFVRRWNDGALAERFYRDHAGPSSENTAYKWSFANGDRRPARPRKDSPSRPEPSRPARGDASDQNDSEPDIGPSLSPPRGSQVGPTLPTPADRQLAREEEREERRRERKAESRSKYEKANEAVPRSGGREGKMEEKRATNAQNRQMREKDPTGELEMDEGTLLGSNDSFAAALRARDSAQSWRAEKKAMADADRRAADEERLAERKAKENATMDMFKALARQRFG